MFAANSNLLPIRVVVVFNGLAILVVASGFGSLVGCASKPATTASSAATSAATSAAKSLSSASTGVTAAPDPVGSVPSDLWIEVDISPGRGVKDRAKIEERAARFVLLPDGSLHGEADRVPHDGLRPARVRRLSREQMVDVWSTLRSLGFADAGFADTRGNPKLVEPAAGEVLATLEVHANGERFVFVRRYQPGGDDQPAMRRMVRSIASLAWSSDEALAETAELPLRYDLGSDPYARFAKPAVTPPSTNPSTTPTINPTPAPAVSPSGSAKP